MPRTPAELCARGQLLPAGRAADGLPRRAAGKAAHRVRKLRRDRAHGRHADAEPQHIAHHAAAAAAAAHVADALGVGLLHLGLQHVLLVVPLRAHDLGLRLALHGGDLRLRRAREPQRVRLRLRGDAPALALKALAHERALGRHALRLGGGGLLFNLDLAARGGDLRLALRLRGAHLGLRAGKARLHLHGLQLAQVAEVRVVLGQDDGGDVKLRHGQPVFLKPGRHIRPHVGREREQVLVHLQDVEPLLADALRQMALDHGGDHRAERALQGFGERLAPLRPGDAAARADELCDELFPVRHGEVQLAAGADVQRQPQLRLQEAHLAVRAPFERHLHGFVDEIDLAVERVFPAGDERLFQVLDEDVVLRIERVPARAERRGDGAVGKEDQLQRLVNDELAPVVEVLAAVLSDERVVSALVLDDVYDVQRHDPLPRFVWMVCSAADAA